MNKIAQLTNIVEQQDVGLSAKDLLSYTIKSFIAFLLWMTFAAFLVAALVSFFGVSFQAIGFLQLAIAIAIVALISFYKL